MEKAIAKVTAGSVDESRLTLDQFSSFLDAIQSNVNFDEMDVEDVVATYRDGDKGIVDGGVKGAAVSQLHDGILSSKVI